MFSPPNNSNIANKTTLSWINPKELIEGCTGSGEHETRCCNLCTYHLQCAGEELSLEDNSKILTHMSDAGSEW